MIRKTWLSLAVLLVASSATAAEFQPMGALGIGGAGVARITNGYAPYWNPAGLAFNEQTMSIPLDVSVGLKVSKGLADNVDRLSKFTEDKAVFDNIKTLNSTSGTSIDKANAVGDVVNFISIINAIDTQKGTISLNANAALALQIKHFGTGVFATMEAFARPDVDMKNVLPQTNSNDTAPAISRADFVTAAGTSGVTTTYFSTDQKTQITTAFTSAGFTSPDATNIINAIGNRLAQGNVTVNGSTLPSIDPATVTRTLTTVVAPAFSAPAGTNTISNNQTAVLIKNLVYLEIPFSYGHPIDMGNYGKLGIGGSVKIVRGRVYQSSIQLVNGDEGVKSNDIVSNFNKNFEESTGITADLGAFWKYKDWLNVGLVAKNLTSPKFKSPALKDQNGNLVTTDAKGNPVSNEDVKLKPQVRMGIALEPWSWLTFAADLDLTENETVLSGLGYKSRTLGGGVEIHPGRWFKIRAGMYKNLANDEIGPVATAGLTFGLPWLNLEVDGAYGLETAQYKEKSYPKEAKVQAQLNIQY